MFERWQASLGKVNTADLRKSNPLQICIITSLGNCFWEGASFHMPSHNHSFVHVTLSGQMETQLARFRDEALQNELLIASPHDKMYLDPSVKFDLEISIPIQLGAEPPMIHQQGLKGLEENLYESTHMHITFPVHCHSTQLYALFRQLLLCMATSLHIPCHNLEW